MKYLRISAMAAVLSLALTVPALAAGPFSDVSAGTALYDSVMYLADRGITAGTGEGRFSPAQPMTVNQWAVMLCRAYGGSDWREESRSSVAAAYQKGWVHESAVLYPDTRLCRGALYEYGFAAAGIPVYDASLYPGGQALFPYENLMRIGKQLGLWPEEADPYSIVNRGEACCFLYALLTRSFTVEAPPAPVKLENPAGVNTNDYLLELHRIPAPILDAFNAAGWKCSIDFDYTAALGERFSASCTGATSYEKRTIYLAGEEAVLHEFGHFLEGTLDFPAEHERLFRAEGENAPLRNYAKTDSAEYFADCFAYWVANSGSTQAMARFQAAAPRTYAYFQALAADGWGVSSGSFAPVHGA